MSDDMKLDSLYCKLAEINKAQSILWIEEYDIAKTRIAFRAMGEYVSDTKSDSVVYFKRAVPIKPDRCLSSLDVMNQPLVMISLESAVQEEYNGADTNIIPNHS